MAGNPPNPVDVTVTQSDIRAALDHLGWDNYDDICEWAISNHEMERFDDLAKAFARHRLTTEQARPIVQSDDVVERVAKIKAMLRAKARSSSDIQRQMMEAKSLRQTDNTERRVDLYYWPKPEETVEWQAADLIANLQARIARLEEAGDRMAEALSAITTKREIVTNVDTGESRPETPEEAAGFVRRHSERALTEWRAARERTAIGPLPEQEGSTP